ncbi:MAG TPA: hypothetical protein VG711_11375 [Phycisphaerales bacterium]|nr:hypothetical protein [Phycisphaerales bacterium]
MQPKLAAKVRMAAARVELLDRFVVIFFIPLRVSGKTGDQQSGEFRFQLEKLPKFTLFQVKKQVLREPLWKTMYHRIAELRLQTLEVDAGMD